jgi:signal transduction histidine kinase
MVEADQALLQQALNNLVENALKYTEQSGKVHVRAEYVPAETKGPGVLFSVLDTGIGIAPVDQVRLFEKFYRVARRGKGEQRGTGLGLAIVKSIADRHAGRVWVESKLGKGSAFYLFIPVKHS